MKALDSRRAGRMAGIGALAGGTVAGIITAWVYLSQIGGARFVAQGLLTFGASGAAGGAICGLVLWLLTESAVARILGAIAGGMIGCLCVGMAMLWYAWSPWPGPKVYPGIEVTAQVGATGSWGQSRTSSYTV